jgi:pimeloyl-ACP methyl ester carboxylesterase
MSYICTRFTDLLNNYRKSLIHNDMKSNRIILKNSLIIVFVLLFIASCKKEDQSKSYSYYVSKQLSVEYNKAYINSLLDLQSATFPELASIKPLVTSDISVYKIIYKTTVNGEKIDASGLICVPKTPGSYPVLSFQNGTNTVDASCPSNSPLSPTYQMIELIASMGYVVVIADYPGFGESAQITHPYLITEPTVRSLVDLLYSAKEMVAPEFPGISLKNEYYLLGYSQGGWATFALHKALEQNYSGDFNLKGSSCGAGAYDIMKLLLVMVNKSTYPVPAYLADIVHAYTAYNQFTNPATDIFNEPYASLIPSLFNGSLSLDQIDTQLTTSIAGLLTPDFLSGFAVSAKYSTIRDALNKNSISAWHTSIPVLFVHGGSDTQVDPSSTENMYSAMIQAGTSTDIAKKLIVPGVDHSDGAIPCMLKGILFLNNLKGTK